MFISQKLLESNKASWFWSDGGTITPRVQKEHPKLDQTIHVTRKIHHGGLAKHVRHFCASVAHVLCTCSVVKAERTENT